MVFESQSGKTKTHNTFVIVTAVAIFAAVVLHFDDKSNWNFSVQLQHPQGEITTSVYRDWTRVQKPCRNRSAQKKNPVGEEALSIGIENGKEEASSQLCESRRRCRSPDKIKSQMQIQCKSVAKDNSALRTKGIQGNWKTYL